MFFFILFISYANVSESEKKYNTIEDAKKAGAITLNYGKFFQQIINFLITTLCLYVIMKCISKVYKRHVALGTDFPCPKCKEMVKEGAVRCPHCCFEPIEPEKEKEKTKSGSPSDSPVTSGSVKSEYVFNVPK